MLILNPLERPPCPKCHTSMMLARISPDGPGFENRSYECPKCWYVQVDRVVALPTAENMRTRCGGGDDIASAEQRARCTAPRYGGRRNRAGHEPEEGDRSGRRRKSE